MRLDNIQISHETINQYIKKQIALGSDLYKNLRHKGKKYCTRKEKTLGRGLIANRLQKVESRKVNEVKDCIIKYLRKMSLKYKQTIAFNHGKAFSQHELLSKALKIKCYFDKPDASWESGVNEHTNGLSRQYLPK